MNWPIPKFGHLHQFEIRTSDILNGKLWCHRNTMRFIHFILLLWIAAGRPLRLSYCFGMTMTCLQGHHIVSRQYCFRIEASLWRFISSQCSGSSTIKNHLNRSCILRYLNLFPNCAAIHDIHNATASSHAAADWLLHSIVCSTVRAAVQCRARSTSLSARSSLWFYCRLTHSRSCG